MIAKSKQKIVAIVGPTASGKSSWAVDLAKRFHGVVISADSRQVYKGLDTVTAKITPDEMQGVPHYLIDIVPIGADFNVTKYQKLAYLLINRIEKENKKGNPILPIIAGGTGLYVSAVCDGYEFAEAKPDKALRAKLEKKSLPLLQKQLLKLDPDTKADLNNPRRVIRAIEIALSGALPPKKNPRYEVLKIGISTSPQTLEKNIRKRIKALDFDKLFAETKKLSRFKGLGSDPMATWYKPAMDFLAGKITRPQLVEAMVAADLQYSKRQMTWFRKDKEIKWVKTPLQAKGAIKGFWLV